MPFRMPLPTVAGNSHQKATFDTAIRRIWVRGANESIRSGAIKHCA